MKEATFYVICGDKNFTELALRENIIDSITVIANISQEIILKYKEHIDLTIELAGKKIDEIKKNFEEEGQIGILIHLVSINIDGNIIENLGDVPPYINKTINTIFTPMPLHIALENLGVKVEYDENNNIL